jgi:hypothetical protein
MSKLPFPRDIFKQHSVFLGKTGSGKSSKLRLSVEDLLDQDKRVCIIDPKGDWWGLKTSHDGKAAGYPVVLFGDFNREGVADVPINKYSGKDVAELVATGNRPCVIGFGGWFTSDMVQFWIDFASTLFTRNRGELYLVGDEFHNFAPKGKIMDPQAGKCLHWSNRLLSEGRGLGIVCLIASQRPQKVHNDTLTSCETLFALRMTHAADRGAVKDWIDGCGEKETGKVVLDSLANIKRTDGYVWSPEIGFGPQLVTFPLFRTFDSFAPPQLQKHLNKVTWDDIDLTEVKYKLAKVIEDHKANDPALLKQKIAELQRNLTSAQQNPVSVQQPRVVEVSVLTPGDRDTLHRLIKETETLQAELKPMVACVQKLNEDATTTVRRLLNEVESRNYKTAQSQPHQPAKVLPRSIQKANPVPAPTPGDLKITGPQQKILDALAWYESLNNFSPRNIMVGAIAMMDATGGYFSNVVTPLSSAGLIQRGNGTTSLTPEGRKYARKPERITTMAEYHDMLRERVRRSKNGTGKTVEILNYLIKCAGESVACSEIGEGIGVDHTGGYFSNIITPLSTLGLIERSNGQVTPTEIVFPKGL